MSPVPAEWKVPVRAGSREEFRRRLDRVFVKLTGHDPSSFDRHRCGSVRWFAHVGGWSVWYMDALVAGRHQNARSLQRHHWALLTLLEQLAEYAEELAYYRKLGL